jgi:hypothetical protein
MQRCRFCHIANRLVAIVLDRHSYPALLVMLGASASAPVCVLDVFWPPNVVQTVCLKVSR